MQYQNLIFFALMAGVVWFLIIRPQQQRQKQHRDMLEQLAAGDEIVTIGGIYATVVEIGERIRVAVADGSELELARPAIAQIVEKPAAADDEEVEREAAEQAEVTETDAGNDDA